MPITELRAKIRDILEKEAEVIIHKPDWDYEAIEHVWDSFQETTSKWQYEQEIFFLHCVNPVSAIKPHNIHLVVTGNGRVRHG